MVCESENMAASIFIIRLQQWCVDLIGLFFEPFSSDFKNVFSNFCKYKNQRASLIENRFSIHFWCSQRNSCKKFFRTTNKPWRNYLQLKCNWKWLPFFSDYGFLSHYRNLRSSLLSEFRFFHTVLSTELFFQCQLYPLIYRWIQVHLT